MSMWGRNCIMSTGRSYTCDSSEYAAKLKVRIVMEKKKKKKINIKRKRY